MTLETALNTMWDTAPMHWWRYVPCDYCCAKRGEVCVLCGPMECGPARQAHRSRYKAGLLFHGTLWLLNNGYEADVIGEVQRA